MVGKKKKIQKKKNDYWFSPKGVISNFKSIHWTSMKSRKDGTEGVLKKYGKVVFFILCFAVLFVGIDASISALMRFAGFFG